MFKQDDIAHKLDHMSQRELDVVAFVPGLLFILVPLVDVGICVLNNYLFPVARTVYYDIVSTFVYPLGMVFAVGAALCVCWRFVRKRERPTRARMVTMLFFSVFLVLALVSTLVNGSNPYRFQGYYPSMVGMYAYALFVLVYFWASSHVSAERLRRLLCDLLCVVSIPVGIHALWLAAAYGAPNFAIRERPEGIFYNTNHYGYYLVLVLVLAAALFVLEAKKPKRVFYLGIFVFNTVVLILNNTFGAYLAAIAGMIALLVGTWLVRRPLMRWSLFVSVLFVALLGIVSIWDPAMLSSFTKLLFDISLISGGEKEADAAGSGRWRLWKATVGFIAERPLLGWGAEGFADTLEEVAGNPRTHCEPLMYAAFFGIPAALCYLGACASVLVANIRGRLVLDDTALACLFAAFAYFVSSLVGNMCFYTSPLFFIVMGLSFAAIDKPSPERAETASHVG